MKMYRLMGILLMLENTSILTAKELADHFEVSIRTIYRDLDTLSQAGFSIVTESGHGGGISLMNSKGIQLKAMDENEILSLVQKIIVKDSKDVISENIALKIRGQLTEASQKTFDILKKTTIVDHTAWDGKDHSVEDKRILIQKAILGQLKMKVDYEGNQGLTIDRIIHPLGLAQKNQHWYLVAYCEMRRDYRVFKLTKMTTLKLCDTDFKMPPYFDLEAFWNESIKRYTGQESKKTKDAEKEIREKGYPVEIECDQNQLRYLDAFELIVTSEKAHTFNLISEDIAMSQLFLHCDEITITSPDALKNRIRRKAEMILTHQSFLQLYF